MAWTVEIVPRMSEDKKSGNQRPLYWSSCLVHLSVRDNRRVSEIDLF